MGNFFGYFVWGLILAAPLAWLIWRLRLPRWLPRVITRWWRRRAPSLPPQLYPLVIRGRRVKEGSGGRR